MAPLTEPLDRAYAIQAASRRLRAQSAASRHAAREARRTYHAVLRQLITTRERREDASTALGTWPYWAPATRELLNVLVVADR